MPFVSQIDTLQNQYATPESGFSIPKNAAALSRSSSTFRGSCESASGSSHLSRICNKLSTNHLLNSLQISLTPISPALLTGLAIGVVGTLTVGKILNNRSCKSKSQINSQIEREKRESHAALQSLKVQYNQLLTEKNELEVNIASLYRVHQNSVFLDHSGQITGGSEVQAESLNSEKENMGRENALSSLEMADSNSENADILQRIASLKTNVPASFEETDSVADTQTTLSNKTPEELKMMVMHLFHVLKVMRKDHKDLISIIVKFKQT